MAVDKWNDLFPPGEEPPPLKPESAASILKKFTFTCVKAFQLYLVFCIMKGLTFAGQTAKGSFTVQYIPYLILASFLTEFFDFFLAIFPISASLKQANGTVKTAVTTTILNAVMNPTWGVRYDEFYLKLSCS